MVDKKIVAIAILVMVAALGWGMYLKADSEVKSLKYVYGIIDESLVNMNLKYSELEGNYSQLEGELEELLDEAFSKDAKISELEAEITSLEKILETGEAITESAEWISDDECLKGTSEVIVTRELWLWNIYLPSTYTVRVNITNIGDKPIDKVYIFLFPYTNGEFTSRYDSNIAESLYIGETYSHDFSISAETTSYKILVVAG